MIQAGQRHAAVARPLSSRSRRRPPRRAAALCAPWLLAVVAALLMAPGALASQIFTVPGYRAPGTPLRYDQVQVRRYGSPTARKVLVLVPGTLAGASDFSLIGPYLATHVPGLQVWAEERREGALEDNSVLLQVLAGKATVQQAFNYYLGWLANPSITPHYQPLDPAQYGFVANWGLKVAMEDLHRVILQARDGGRRTVILGGHSLGGAEAAIYPTWDFGGHPGYKDIAGIVGIDGGVLAKFPVAGAAPPTTVAQARQAVAPLVAKPWLDLLGAGLPWSTGPFGEISALAAKLDPNGPSLLQSFPLLPAELDPPVPVTNAAALGFAFDASTSPAALALIHIHSGHVASSGTPRGWVDDGITPIQDLADAFSIEPLGPIDWYYPARLSLDVEVAASLRSTPASRYLGLSTPFLHQVDVPYYAFQTSLGGTGNSVADGARAYQRLSRVPSLEIVDRKSTYSHLDPLLAAPAHNDFLKTVVPWLKRIKSG
jgi:hypothetical protein